MLSKNYFTIFSVSLVIIFITGCEKRDFTVKSKINTESASNITAKQAQVSGTIIDLGNGLIDYGHCWSKSSSPGLNDSKTSFGKAEKYGGFTSVLTNLQPGTKYYVRAYATDEKGTNFGKEVSFSTMDGKAVLTTSGITDISFYSAKGGGNVTSAGGDQVLGKGICWDTLNTASVLRKAGMSMNGTGLGVFSSDLSGLLRGKTYFVRAWARTSIDTTYGEILSFKTLTGIPVLTTTEIMITEGGTALGGGNITSDGGSPVTARGVCWDINPNPTKDSNHTSDGAGAGIFSSTLTGLNIGSSYYVRAYATNMFTTSYGQQISFVECFDAIGIAIDNCQHTFTTESNAPWIAVTDITHDGVDAVRSGIIPNYGYTYIRTSVVGAGTLSFWWKVSSEYGYDFLSVYVDDIHYFSISGEVDWQYKEISLNAGNHYIVLQYTKDLSLAHGYDCGWVDQFSFTPN